MADQNEHYVDADGLRRLGFSEQLINEAIADLEDGFVWLEPPAELVNETIALCKKELQHHYEQRSATPKSTASGSIAPAAASNRVVADEPSRQAAPRKPARRVAVAAGISAATDTIGNVQRSWFFRRAYTLCTVTLLLCVAIPVYRSRDTLRQFFSSGTVDQNAVSKIELSVNFPDQAKVPDVEVGLYYHHELISRQNWTDGRGNPITFDLTQSWDPKHLKFFVMKDPDSKENANWGGHLTARMFKLDGTTKSQRIQISGQKDGAQVMLGDGAVNFLSENIDYEKFRNLTTNRDSKGELLY